MPQPQEGPHPESQVTALISVEQLNPPQRYAIPCERLLAVHKVIGYVPPEIGGDICVRDIRRIGVN
jgi:hypothetical protein